MKTKNAEDGWQGVLALFAHLSPAELDELFELFLTLEEKEDVAKRFLILKLLLERKLTQREIAEEAKVSISKITRGSNALKVISKHLREALLKLM